MGDSAFLPQIPGLPMEQMLSQCLPGGRAMRGIKWVAVNKTDMASAPLSTNIWRRRQVSPRTSEYTPMTAASQTESREGRERGVESVFQSPWLNWWS